MSTTTELTTDPRPRTHAPEETPMSTTTTAHPQVDDTRPQLEDVRPLGFGALLRTELRKMADTRTGRWLLVAIVLITALAMGAVLWVNRDSGAGLESLIMAANIPQAILIPILGIMTAANEWSQRTALITFSQEPRRLRVMTAKTVAAVLLGLAVIVVCGVIGVLAHVVSVSLAGGEIDLSLPMPLVVGFLVAQVIGLLWGVAYGAALLNVPLAIVAYVMVPTLSPLVFTLTSWLREHAAWLDLTTAQVPLLGDTWPSATQWAQVAVTAGIWVLLPLAFGLWRVSRKEVK